MRINTDSRDREAYLAWVRCRPVRVFLDGVECRRGFMADEEGGVIERAALDEKGRVLVVGGEVVREEVRGRVRIEKIA